MFLLTTNVIQYNDVVCMTCRLCWTDDVATGHQAVSNPLSCEIYN